jgi:hypothetical protein
LLTNKIEKQINDQLKATKQLTAKTGIDKELTTRLKHIIVSVDGNTDVNFIHNFVDNEFFAMDSRAFRKYIKQMQPDVDMSFDFVCTKCNELNSEVKLPINVQFFWPGA